jgi:hypothetical protein
MKPESNLAIFRYIGQDNSDADVVDSSDTIYVEQARGCEGLSDAEIQADFDN